MRRSRVSRILDYLPAVILVWVVCIGVLAGLSARDTANKIQNERARSTRMTCVDTNSRHDQATAYLDGGYKAFERERSLGVEERARLQQSKDFSFGLIEILAPKKDCDELVRSRVTQP